MDKDLQKLKEIFLASDVDDEDRDDNLKKITEWENSIRESEDFLSWQSSDITRKLAEQAKNTFKDNAMSLATNRTMTEEERKSVFAKQDAMLWILSMIEKDVKGTLSQVQGEIRRALKAE